MSTRSILFAVAVLAGGLFSSGALAVDGTMTADAPMRVGPNEMFAEIGTVGAGSALKIHSCQAGYSWCMVRISGRSDWVPGTLIKIGGFSKAKSYYDPAAKVALQYDVNDHELFDDTLLGPRGRPLRRFRGDRAFDHRRFRGDRVFGAHDYRMHPYSRFPDNRAFGAHSFPVYPFDYFGRSRLSDKRLPRSFRSTINTLGLRLHKQGFPEKFGD